MSFAVFLGLTSVTGTLVLDKKGQLKVLAEGVEPQPGEAVLSVVDGQDSSELAGIDVIGENGQVAKSARLIPSDNQDIADIISQIETGQDPTQNEDQATAAGDAVSSSISQATTVEATQEQVLAATFFETTGLNSQDLNQPQTDTLLDILANSAPVTVFDARNFDEESLDGDLNLSFPTDANNDTLTLTITELPKLGVLTLADGTPVKVGQVLTEAEFESLQYDAPQEYTAGDDAGQILYTVDDGRGAENSVQTGGVLLTINPINDIPDIIDVGSADVVEAGSLDDGTNVDGIATAEGQIIATDDDTDAVLSYGVENVSNEYGTLSVDALTGEWVFTLDNNAPATQALKEGESVDTTFTITVTDDKGAQVTQTLPITIEGTNDVPTFGASGDTTGMVTESGDGAASNSVATGVLAATDVDADAILDYQVIDGLTDFGEMTFDDEGKWTFTLDNESNATQALTEGEIKQLDFVVTVTDEYGAVSREVVSITITGTNDTPVIDDLTGTTGLVTEAGHLDDGTVVTGTATASDTINASDVDGTITFTYQGQSDFGSFEIDAQTGVWSFQLDNDSAAAQALREGQETSVVFDVIATDEIGAFVTQPVTITIVGTNDQPTILSSSDLQGSVTESGHLDDGTLVDGVATATGTLIGSDVDASANLTFFIEDGNSDFGTMTVDPDGTWEFTLDNETSQSQSLKEGEVHNETFTVTVRDEFGAVNTEVITIAITGTNDQPVFTSSSTLTGEVTESGHNDDGTEVAGTPTASGVLFGSDVDSDALLTFSTDDGSSDYGDLSVAADGTWLFTLNNDSAQTQALKEGQKQDVNFSVKVTDEFGAVNTEMVTITITGTNDVPVIEDSSVVTGSVIEAGDDNVPGVDIATGNIVATDVDADSVASFSYSGESDFGTFVIDPVSGDWTFTLDNDADATQALKDGQVQDVTYTVSVTDDKGAVTSQDVVITITGSNDSATVISGDSDELTEDVAVVGNNLIASEQLVISDEDAGENVFNAGAGASVGTTLGSLSILADGTWTYTIDNTLTQVQALDVGDTLVESFIVTSADGTEHTISVTVNGAEDETFITNYVPDSVKEDTGEVAGELLGGGKLDIADLDAGEAAFNTTVTSLNNDQGQSPLGTLTILADGTWTYKVDNSLTGVQELGAGDTRIE
ncbi:VCBS domain-containing protein, partial [Vibrio nomapromontoriensis]|uniref:VCBS domain-containing protein n=1 Tax=Vibrio nomapromontoriensis TaxID=2910246 RepID=UPI003D09A1BD